MWVMCVKVMQTIHVALLPGALNKLVIDRKWHTSAPSVVGILHEVSRYKQPHDHSHAALHVRFSTVA